MLYVFINKKNKKYGKLDTISMTFSDTNDIREAKIIYIKYKGFHPILFLNDLLKSFRIKSKYEIHALTITTQKIK